MSSGIVTANASSARFRSTRKPAEAQRRASAALTHALFSWLALQVSAGLMPAQVAQAQAAPLVVSQRVACGDCRILLTETITLRDTAAASELDPDPDQQLVRDSRGWHYLVTSRARDRITVFDPNGLARARLGRRGSGPGEFRANSSLAVGPGDSVHLWDRSLRRMSVLSPAPAVRVVRSYPFPHAISGGFVVLPDGRVVANADVGEAEHVGQPMSL